MFTSFKKLFRSDRSRTITNRVPTRTARLGLETLTDRVLMSATPLNWTAPATGANTVLLAVVKDTIQIIDNGKLVASQAVAATSSISLTGNSSVKSGFEVLSTPAGIPTTITLANPNDSVFVGDPSSPSNPFGLPTSGPFGGTPTVQGVQGILGNLTVTGRVLGLNALTVDDSSDTAARTATLADGHITGLARGTISFSTINTVSVHGSSGSGSYTISGAQSRLDFYDESTSDRVALRNTSGTVTAHGMTNSAITMFASGTGNTFSSNPTGATLSGSGYTQKAMNFRNIHAFGSSADSAALIGASTAPNTLTANSTDTTLSGQLYTDEVSGFGTVTATGYPDDTATLTGASTGVNALSATPNHVTLSGANYSITANSFATTTSYSKSASDTATLSGSNYVENTFAGNPTTSTFRTGAVSNTASGFRNVTAVSGSSLDIASLETSSAGGSTLNAQPTDVVLSGATYSIDLSHFGTVDAFSLSNSDHADFFGSGFFVATPSQATIIGAGFDRQVTRFASVTEYVSVDSLGHTLPYTLNNDGTLTKQTATGPVSVDTGVQGLAVGALGGSNYIWDLTTAGAHNFGPSTPEANTYTWLFTNLHDPNVQWVVFRDLVRDGTLTYNDMLEVFGAAESNYTVSATTFLDLEIVASEGTALHMPDYLKALTNDVVFGGPQNTTIHSLNTQGKVLESALGNLQVGSTADQLSRLVDVWFNGVAEPYAPDYDAPNDPTKYHSYRAAPTIALFNGSGPSYTDVRQGDEGDCWVMAPLAEAAAREPDLITKMFTFDGLRTVNGAVVGVYTVHFYDNQGKDAYVTVDTELPDGGDYFDHPNNGAVWAALAEKAYVVANGLGWVTSHQIGTYCYSALDFGSPAWGLQAISPIPTTAQPTPDGAGTAFLSGRLVVLSTVTPSDPKIVGRHVYALIGYDPTSSKPYTLYNPWGLQAPDAPYYGIVNCDLTYLKQNFTGMTVGGTANMTGEGTNEASTSVPPGALSATNGPDHSAAYSFENEFFMAPEVDAPGHKKTM